MARHNKIKSSAEIAATAADGQRRSKRRAVNSVSAADDSRHRADWWRRRGAGERIAVIVALLLLTLGATGAGLKYLEESARREQALNVGKSNFEKQEPSLLSKVNPFVPNPTPAPTPQLSKEYIYAGSRMLAVEDANADAAPPADLAVWRPGNGYWYVLGGAGSQQTFVQWGQAGDQTVPGDFDGDGKTDFSVWRPAGSLGGSGTWYIRYSSSGALYSITFGLNNDKVAPADYDGDGKTDVAVYRPTTGYWYITRSSDQSFYAAQLGGVSGDVPTPADFDGDGKADLAVRRSTGKFHILPSGNPTVEQQIHFGDPSDVPVVGDYDGDGKADAAVWRGAPYFQWHALLSGSQTIQSTTLGDPATDIAVQNDYDGDGKTDMAIWRPSEGKWYIQQSASGQPRYVVWGQNGDIPVPAYYRR